MSLVDEFIMTQFVKYKKSVKAARQVYSTSLPQRRITSLRDAMESKGIPSDVVSIIEQYMDTKVSHRFWKSVTMAHFFN